MALKDDAYDAFTAGDCTFDTASGELTGDNCVAFKLEVSDKGKPNLDNLDNLDLIQYPCYNIIQ